MMSNDWILDVLNDLRSYAGKNGLEALAEQLDETIFVAAVEISTEEDRARSARHPNVVASRAPIRASFPGPNA